MSSPHPHDLSSAVWRISSHSKDADTCVEVAQNLPGTVAVRDSVDPAGPALTFTPGEWRAFTAAVKRH
jgi:hypothetical protein